MSCTEKWHIQTGNNPRSPHYLTPLIFRYHLPLRRLGCCQMGLVHLGNRLSWSHVTVTWVANIWVMVIFGHAHQGYSHLDQIAAGLCLKVFDLTPRVQYINQTMQI